MRDAKQRDDWERHSVLLATLENVNKTKDQKATHPDERNPFKARPAVSSTTVRIGSLKGLFKRTRKRGG